MVDARKELTKPLTREDLLAAVEACLKD